MTDVSIDKFSDMVATDEKCALIARVDHSTVKVVYIGVLEECLDRFEEGTHSIARLADLQKEYDKTQNKG